MSLRATPRGAPAGPPKETEEIAMIFTLLGAAVVVALIALGTGKVVEYILKKEKAS
jgi:hypothetical protein